MLCMSDCAFLKRVRAEECSRSVGFSGFLYGRPQSEDGFTSTTGDEDFEGA